MENKEKEEYICDICGKACKSGGGFAKHYKSHTIEELEKSGLDNIITNVNLDDEIFDDKNLIIMSCGHMGNGKRCMFNCPNVNKPYFED